MGKPRMIIVIRHAQSEGNKNRDIHQTVPDHRVKLTDEGWSQAHEAGRRLRSLLRADDTLHFFTSPYRRTRETTEGILHTLTSPDPSPSPFQRQGIKVYEEPRLREQDFGNFQPCSAEMERMWQERADYGHFFYRIPNGESAADAYDRVSGFNESLWRQFGEDDFASVCVLVTHGLMSRVFLMKWYHFSVEYFEDLRNVNHCEFLIMRKSEDSGKYILENQLRTWSELKRERTAAQLEKTKEKSEKFEKVEPPQSPIPRRRRWGGCPNGCHHGRSPGKKESSIHSKKQVSKESLLMIEPEPGRRLDGPWQGVDKVEEDEDDPRGRTGPPKAMFPNSLDKVNAILDGTASSSSNGGRPKEKIKYPSNSFPLLRVGRDFGGSASGNTSAAGSDTEFSGGEERSKSRSTRDDRKASYVGESGMGRGAKANTLGDQSDSESDGHESPHGDEVDGAVESEVY